MNKGLITTLLVAAGLVLAPATVVATEIYKVVDEDGNVTFTDQRPSSDAQPVDLPPLSVVETDQPEPQAVAPAAEPEGGEALLTPRDLRRIYRDFRIIQPADEETFWGTANTVVVSWGSTEPIAAGMRVILYVNGEAQDVPGAGSVSLTLDRGEHQVYAELRDTRNRRVMTTDTVTFFVKQHSVNFGFRHQVVLPHHG